MGLPPRETLVFELAEAPSQALILHGRPHTTPKDKQPKHLAPLLPGVGPRPPSPPTQLLGTAAATLNRQLKQVQAPSHHLEAWHDNNPSTSTTDASEGILARLPRLATSVGNLMQPQGDTRNDDCPDQRLVNIVTSLPFFAIGARMLQKHRTPEGREYAWSMMAVGAAATLYHASSGKFRPIARKIDYWTIAASSASMLKAIYPSKPWLRRSASASMLAIPFKPFLVSTANTMAMQAEFIRQASAHKGMRRHFTRHAVATAAGAVAFAVEDALLDRGFGHVHAIWHLLAAAGVATTGALVEHKELLRVEGDVKQAVEEGLGMRRGRGMHDSAASFQALGGNGGSRKVSPRTPPTDALPPASE